MATDRDQPDPAPILVLGLGNLLLGDDGAGLALLEGLQARLAPSADLEFVDGGTQGLALLERLAGRRALLLLDAVALGADPGTLHVLSREDGRGHARAATGHESNAGDLLAAATLLGDRPECVTVLGIEPARLETGIGLSPPVAAALPGAIDAAIRTVREWTAVRSGEEIPCTR